MQKIVLLAQLLLVGTLVFYILNINFQLWDTAESTDYLSISLKPGAYKNQAIPSQSPYQSHKPSKPDNVTSQPPFQPSNNTYEDFSDFAGKDHHRNPEKKEPIKHIHRFPPETIPNNDDEQSKPKDNDDDKSPKTPKTQHNNFTSITGDSDDDIKRIFKPNPQNDSQCPLRDVRPHFLCNLSLKGDCVSQYPSEVLDTFWIVCPIYTANQKQTERLYYLHGNFRSYVQSYGINFQTVEVIFPGQEFQLTKPNTQPYDLQYKDEWIFAMRENLVNVGIKHLPDDWQFVSWVDQHIFWMDPYWFEKSIVLMSHYNIVHLLNGNDFKNMTNGTDYSLRGVVKYYYEVGVNYWRYVPQQWGLAWATNKETYEKLGGLLDICIGTKCDFYQAVTYTGVMFDKMTNNEVFNSEIKKWQEQAIKVYDGKVGFLDSKVLHFIHCMEGCRTSQYDQQIGLLYQHNYNPLTDLTRDKEGRLSLTNNTPLAEAMWRLYGGGPRS